MFTLSDYKSSHYNVKKVIYSVANKYTTCRQSIALIYSKMWHGRTSHLCKILQYLGINLGYHGKNYQKKVD